MTNEFKAEMVLHLLSRFIGGTIETTIGIDSWRATIVAIETNPEKNYTLISMKDVFKLDRDTQTFSIQNKNTQSIFSTDALHGGTLIFKNQFVAKDGDYKTFVFTTKEDETKSTTKYYRSIDDE